MLPDLLPFVNIRGDRKQRKKMEGTEKQTRKFLNCFSQFLTNRINSFPSKRALKNLSDSVRQLIEPTETFSRNGHFR